MKVCVYVKIYANTCSLSLYSPSFLQIQSKQTAKDSVALPVTCVSTINVQRVRIGFFSYYHIHRYVSFDELIWNSALPVHSDKAYCISLPSSAKVVKISMGPYNPGSMTEIFGFLVISSSSTTLKLAPSCDNICCFTL